MRLSEKRKQDVYEAIHEAVTQARIALKRAGADCGTDYVVARIVNDAYERVKVALNLEPPQPGKEG